MDRGVLFGIDRRTQTPVLIDPFDPTLDNANLAVIAPSGAGKSYFTKLLALRALLLGVAFLVIDPEDEYRRVARNAVGTARPPGATARSASTPSTWPSPNVRDTSRKSVTGRAGVPGHLLAVSAGHEAAAPIGTPGAAPHARVVVP